MHRLLQKMTLAVVAIGVVTVTIGAGASAHVVVKPAEAITAGFQTFTMGVPNEQDSPTVAIELVVPAGLKHVSPTDKPGWTITITRDSIDDEIVTAITWSGSAIDVGFRNDFTFSAQAPATAAELQWKAYQTYANGTTVSWDKASSQNQGGNSGPFSVTKVVATMTADVAIAAAEQAAANARHTADTALYVGIAGVFIGLVAVFFSTRKH